MKKTFNKMKATLTTFCVTLISFSSKVMGQLEQKGGSRSQPEINDVQLLYGVPQIQHLQQLMLLNGSNIYLQS